jgi:superfamily II DNA or RNA helicase
MQAQASLFERPAPAVVDEGDPDGLRVYQREAVTAIDADLAVHKSTLLVMATGLGKTQVFGAEAKHWPGRVLVMAHRKELLEQAQSRLAEMTGERVGLEKAEHRAGRERIVIGSVDTLTTFRISVGLDGEKTKRYRCERFQADPFTLIIIDEAHHAVAASYRKVLDLFPNAKVLGVTATPDRGDKVGLKAVFESTAYERNADEGCRDGYLVRVKLGQVFVKEVDLSHVKTTGGDLNLGELDKEMAKANEAIVKKSLELCEDRPAIVFTTKVQNAHDLAAVYDREAGRNVARVVHGETDEDERAEIFAAHRRGEFQYLVNVGVATEGTDMPYVRAVIIGRPTKSRALYAQMAGRGGRVLPGLVERLKTAEERRAAIAASAKPDFLLLDFVGNAGRHDLVKALHILAGKAPPEVIERAEELTRKGVMNAGDAIREARRQLDAEKMARAARIALLRSRVDARVEFGEPYKATGKDADWKERQSARPEDIEWLLRRGFARGEIPGDHAAVKKLKGRVIHRIKAGLCTWRQERCLQRMGHDTERMTMAQAGQFIAAYKASGWKPLRPDFVARVLSGAREPGEEG